MRRKAHANNHCFPNKLQGHQWKTNPNVLEKHRLFLHLGKKNGPTLQSYCLPQRINKLEVIDIKSRIAR